jgi:hypothetical protein
VQHFNKKEENMSLFGPLIGHLASKPLGEKLGGILGDLGGGLIDRKYQEKREDTELQRRIADGRAAGIHPMASIGAGTPRSTPFNGKGDDIEREIAKSQINVDSAQAELYRAQAKTIEAEARAVAQGGTRGQTIVEGTPSDGITVPRLRPTAQTQARIPIFLPDGTEAMVPQSLAENMGLSPLDQLGAGQYAELVGEIRGEAESTLLMDKIGSNMGIDLGGAKKPVNAYGFTPAGIEAAIGRKLTPREKRSLSRGGFILFNGIKLHTKKER